MRGITSEQAEVEFDAVRELAQHDPVEITKDGRAVAVMLSPEALRALLGQRQSMPPVDLDRLMDRSMARFGKVYEALARWQAEHDGDGTEPPRP